MKILNALLVLLGVTACSPEVTADPTTRMLLETPIIVVTQADENIQNYIVVLKRMAESPPINDEVSDSIAYEIAAAIQKDSEETGLAGSFYLGLLRVENPQLEPYICNWYGACGLTQVVPEYWAGVFVECGDLMVDIYAQICYGARVYLEYLVQWEGDQILALYAYNGCTEAHRERNARCTNFPHWVRDFTREYERDM